jgi:hypothetical protein
MCVSCRLPKLHGCATRPAYVYEGQSFVETDDAATTTAATSGALQRDGIVAGSRDLVPPGARDRAVRPLRISVRGALLRRQALRIERH